MTGSWIMKVVRPLQSFSFDSSAFWDSLNLTVIAILQNCKAQSVDNRMLRSERITFCERPEGALDITADHCVVSVLALAPLRILVG